ncbi:MAG: hypothetical protein ACRDNZ_12050 [Streptosporangiaceae bacterium]
MLAQDCGYDWTLLNEEDLVNLSRVWTGVSGPLQQLTADAHAAAQLLQSANQGQAADAFWRAWNDPQAPRANIHAAASGATGIGIGLIACAGIVLALKVNVIIQLTALAAEIAQAAAEAPETGSLSLAEIPVLKEITGKMIELATNLAMNAVLGS